MPQLPAVFRSGLPGGHEQRWRELGVQTCYGRFPALRCGYRIDSGVTPCVNWENTDDGANFVGAPSQMYRLSGRGDVRLPVPEGPLLEIPRSSGYTRWPFPFWNGVHPLLARRPWRYLRRLGLAAGAGYLRRVVLSPETTSVRDMLTLSRLLIGHGVGCLHLFFHSSSLLPGLTPLVASRADVDRLYASVEASVDRLAATTRIRCRAISEAAACEEPA